MEVKRKIGRPKIKLDYSLIKDLAYLHCTQEEIASFCKCSVDTLQNDPTFSAIYKEGKDNGKMSLRRLQYKSAENGNIAMQIWLGKQLLGQRDKQNVEMSGPEGSAIKVDNKPLDLSGLTDEELELARKLGMMIATQNK